MKTFTFVGFGDNIFGEVTSTHEDIEGRAGQQICYAVIADSGSLIVCGQYSPHKTHCWSISIEPIDECPSWPIRWETSRRSYSQSVVIEAPDDAEVKWVS